MIQFGIAFFEVDIRKYFNQSVIDYRLFSYITVISTIYSQIVYIVNAVLFCQFTKSCFPFRNHDFRNFAYNRSPNSWRLSTVIFVGFFLRYEHFRNTMIAIHRTKKVGNRE